MRHFAWFFAIVSFTSMVIFDVLILSWLSQMGYSKGSSWFWIIVVIIFCYFFIRKLMEFGLVL